MSIRQFFPLLLCLLLSACYTPEQEEEKTEKPIVEKGTVKKPVPVISVDIPDRQFQFSSLELNQHIGDMDLAAFKHYGEFYTEDFTIYRLERFDYLAESYFIEDINLYFIDSLLVKIQAFLKEDKSADFINKYGKAKIYISNYHNKQVLESESLLSKKEGRTIINENLDSYRLKWIRENADIEYVVNKQGDTTTTSDSRLLNADNHRFKLTFQTPDFDYQMAWVKWESYKESRGLVAQPASDQE